MQSCSDKHSCVTCPTRHLTEWRDLAQDQLELVNQAKRTRIYEPGEALFHEGDLDSGIYCIQSGLVGLRRIGEDGHTALLKLCTSGATVGYRSFLTKKAHANSAEVLTPAVICFVPSRELSILLAESPVVGERFLQHALTDLDETEKEFVSRQTASLKSRFLHAMLVFHQQIGVEDDEGRPSFDLPIKKSEIAELLGAQPESISRIIRNVQTAGLIDVSGHRVRIRNLDAVLREAGATV